MLVGHHTTMPRAYMPPSQRTICGFVRRITLSASRCASLAERPAVSLPAGLIAAPLLAARAWPAREDTMCQSMETPVTCTHSTHAVQIAAAGSHCHPYSVSQWLVARWFRRVAVNTRPVGPRRKTQTHKTHQHPPIHTPTHPHTTRTQLFSRRRRIGQISSSCDCPTRTPCVLPSRGSTVCHDEEGTVLGVRHVSQCSGLVLGSAS